MTDTQQTVTPGATLKLSEAIMQALRETWRAAGGVTYSAPKGQMAAIAEPKLFAFLAEYLLAADSTLVDRAVPVVGELGRRCDAAELALRQLVEAVCPGLARGNLLDDAEYARAAMAGADPAAFFAIDETLAEDGGPRYLHVAAEFKSDDDTFPLYRRAPTVGEVQALADQHQVAAAPAAPAKAPAKRAGKA
jgi:hypothetical protein